MGLYTLVFKKQKDRKRYKVQTLIKRKKAGVTMLISDKVDCRILSGTRRDIT